ncbi:flagellar basal-body MS-ring/collar protein FliF [Cognatishimia sp. MH4019]|uniref:flagellar basal-body MS-ring/collar protein FliF n=1 Tax=Cognatishimia sp. MH4019 TaxID=2854030 RepID=UPI001CD6A972
MQQILSVWSSLTLQRRVFVTVATLLMFAAILGVSRLAATPKMALLYSGLEQGAAGEVISRLEQAGVAHDVRGGAIYVPQNERDRLRMTLARDGIPANGSAGYELLDSLSGFGTTSQMFDAAYWRAKEGELARTISASPWIRSARVHIATPSSRAFARNIKPTASVTVTAAGDGVSAGQAKALKYLVSSAVSGLTPEDVSIITEDGILVGREDAVVSGGEMDREQALRSSVERLLEAHVGFGKAIVEVSLETVTDRESIVERRFDPEGRVAISTDTVETTNEATDSAAGGVTVASNLPDGDAAGGGGASSSQNSETRERVNFEVSETQREVLRAPGAIKRLTVAVMVDGIRSTNEDGTTTWAPRTDVEMEVLHDLVASAIGFNEARGDVITLKSLEMTPLELPGTPAAGSVLDGITIDLMSIIQVCVLALTSLVLGLFVVRPILTTSSPASLPAPATMTTTPDGTLPTLTGTTLAADDVMAPEGQSQRLPTEDPVLRLRQMIEERQDETMEILRNWMEEETA